jgi:hypothetical protein
MKIMKFLKLFENFIILIFFLNSMKLLCKINESTWHESAIWFFIAQKLLFANQYVRKFHKIRKFSKNLKIIKLKKRKI